MGVRNDPERSLRGTPFGVGSRAGGEGVKNQGGEAHEQESSVSHSNASSGGVSSERCGAHRAATRGKKLSSRAQDENAKGLSDEASMGRSSLAAPQWNAPRAVVNKYSSRTLAPKKSREGVTFCDVVKVISERCWSRSPVFVHECTRWAGRGSNRGGRSTCFGMSSTGSREVNLFSVYGPFLTADLDYWEACNRSHAAATVCGEKTNFGVRTSGARIDLRYVGPDCPDVRGRGKVST